MPKGRPKVPRVTVTCAACGKKAERYASQIGKNKSGKFFCSLACKFSMGRPKIHPDRTCEQCNGTFRSYGENPRFCSKECRSKWEAERRVELTCHGCGKQFTMKPSQARLPQRTGKWCSRACEAASRIKRPLDRTHNGRPAVLTKDGYVMVYEPDHPNASHGWIFEHRLVMEQEIGRYLERGEHVHHRPVSDGGSGRKDDNRSENLVLMSHSEHSTLTLKTRHAERAAAEAAAAAELEEYRKRYGALT